MIVDLLGRLISRTFMNASASARYIFKRWRDKRTEKIEAYKVERLLVLIYTSSSPENSFYISRISLNG